MQISREEKKGLNALIAQMTLSQAFREKVLAKGKGKSQKAVRLYVHSARVYTRVFEWLKEHRTSQASSKGKSRQFVEWLVQEFDL